jgi:hypothetical protein
MRSALSFDKLRMRAIERTRLQQTQTLTLSLSKGAQQTPLYPLFRSPAATPLMDM